VFNIDKGAHAGPGTIRLLPVYRHEERCCQEESGELGANHYMSAVVKRDLEVPGEITANDSLSAKHTNDCVTRWCFYDPRMQDGNTKIVTWGFCKTGGALFRMIHRQDRTSTFVAVWACGSPGNLDFRQTSRKE
jgi:hypothetical protein